jgi:proline iminopeptidase
VINVIQKIKLGGEDQWYVARGGNAELPLLLFLHGGPGSPQTGAQHKYNRELEDHYIVVNWDQRGSGKSYRPNMDPSTMTIDRLLADAYELTKHLLERFGKTKLVVMGHSMGAILGVQFIARHPELVAAYVGINQPVNRVEEEERTHHYVLTQSKERRNLKALKQMQRMRPPMNGSFESTDDLVTQRTWLTKFGGVTYKKNALWYNLSYIFSSHLTWAERARFMKGFAFSSTALWNQLNATNLLELVTEFKVPVYFIMGLHDKISHDTVARYMQVIKAPRKELIVFEQSGHFACFEENERFNEFMINQVKSEAMNDGEPVSR